MKPQDNFIDAARRESECDDKKRTSKKGATKNQKQKHQDSNVGPPVAKMMSVVEWDTVILMFLVYIEYNLVTQLQQLSANLMHSLRDLEIPWIRLLS